MISEIIDEQLLNEASYEKERNGRFFVTDINKCKRYVYYEFQPEIKKEPYDITILRKFVNGDFVHLKLIGCLRKAGISVHDEAELPENSFNIFGRIDAIVRLGNKKYAIEIKSIYANAFDYLKTPRSQDVKQLQLYLFFKNIKEGFILYENKNNQEIKEFPLQLNTNKVNTLLKHFGLIKNYLDKKTVPPRDFDQSSFQCRFCSYNNYCYKV